MACRTTRQFLNVVLLHQLRSDLFLILRDVGHVEDLAARADVLLRRAVAVDAPLHRERRGLKGQRHLVDASVARGAADAFVDVDAVVEVHEIRQAVDAAPDDRRVRGVAGAHRLEHRGVGPDLCVAVHARLRRRDAGEVRGLDRGVAVAAVDAEARDVVLVAEGNRLLAPYPLIREIRRADDPADDPKDEAGDENRPENGDTRKRIRTSVENLRHSRLRPVPSVISIFGE